MPLNPLHKQGGRVYLLAVMRFSDKTVCAYYAISNEYDKEGVRELVASNASAKLGMRYSVTGPAQSVHYFLDPAGRVFAMVTDPKYPVRVAFGILDEFHKSFTEEFGSKIASAPEDGLNRSSRTMLQSFVEKYADPADADALVAVQSKIDIVKTEMQQNIQQLLINTEQMKKIEESAEELHESSKAFRAGTKELRNKMW
eukprot:CAMPEP_0182429246 /NCGR_PEP_ID=MMETSP1167-20130531/25623_1 /TAXON_ID=2988 /ORGANISM="Mallomonas Sp, Strain CCMP3275" /LENGTH=198 /DNA_ID=CAMNT_0024612647 /DNA_START=200 /DNA_END=793 /DNA_ORIENTATION=+